MLKQILNRAGIAALEASASIEARNAVHAAEKAEKAQAKTAAKAEREQKIQEIIAAQKATQNA